MGRTIAMGVAAAVLAASSANISAQETASVRYLGLVSATHTAETLSSYEAAVDDVLAAISTDYRNRLETLRDLGIDPSLGGLRKQARDAHEAGTAATQQLELDKAVSHFARAESFYEASQTQWLDPKSLTALYEEWAMVHFAQRDTVALENVLRRALVVHPTKQLDPNEFPPDVIASFGRVRADTSVRHQLDPEPLAALARRQNAAFFVAGELSGKTLQLMVVSGDRGWTESVTVASASDPAIEQAVQTLAQRAGIPQPVLISDSTFPPMEDPQRVPLTKRWYFWAGVATLVAASTGIGVATSGGPGGGGPVPTPTTTPPDDGVTIIFDIP